MIIILREGEKRNTGNNNCMPHEHSWKKKGRHQAARKTVTKFGHWSESRGTKFHILLPLGISLFGDMIW